MIGIIQVHLYENICVTNKRWKRMQLPKIYHMVTIEVLSNYLFHSTPCMEITQLYIRKETIYHNI